eukprot:3587243-Pyramimonas_sp.AAC.1
MGPQPKKAKLFDSRRCYHISAAALSSALRMLGEMECPEFRSPSTIARERNKIACQQTTFGQLDQSLNISGVTCWVQHLVWFLEAASRRCCQFRDYRVKTIDDHAGNISICYDCDELVLGSPLRPR